MPFRPAAPRCLATLTIMTFVSLATVPSQGADVHLEQLQPRVQMPAAERWRLRPAEPSVPSTTGSIQSRAETAIPENRRNVRLVYPALIEAR